MHNNPRQSLLEKLLKLSLAHVGIGSITPKPNHFGLPINNSLEIDDFFEAVQKALDTCTVELPYRRISVAHMHLAICRVWVKLKDLK